MKYASILPFTALLALSSILLFIGLAILPPGEQILSSLESFKSEAFYLVIFLIILLESIVYVGFYFPGQFFAVVLVVGANPKLTDIVYLTISMVAAATLGSAINYYIGRSMSQDSDDKPAKMRLRHLLLAMIHINSLAFFMVSQGTQRKSFKVVGYAGLLNLPYYLLLIAGTALLSEQVMQIAENPQIIFTILFLWLCIALALDFKRYKKS